VKFQARRAEYAEIEAMRELFRAEANCQIIGDSLLRRGIADGYALLLNGALVGYGGVYNRYDPGRAMEFFIFPEHRRHAFALFEEFAAESGASEMTAQTNIAFPQLLLYQFGKNIRAENYLFAPSGQATLSAPGGALFRPSRKGELAPDNDAKYVLEAGGKVVAWGDYLTHYNPPFVDIYMETAEGERQKGYGSYFVQEVARICREKNLRPSARCNADNIASRRTLEKAGLLCCGRLLVGDL
jgi:GNAT superfamily N-acetyltransferase